MATISNTYWLKEGLSGGKSGAITTQNEICIIEFSEVVDNVKDALKESGFTPGQRHRNRPEMRLVGFPTAEVVEEDNASSWVFNLTYNDDPMLVEMTSAEEDENYIPEVNFDKWSYTEVVDKDKESGAAIVNPVGDPYDPLPVTTVSSPVLIVTVKENSPNLGRIQDIGSINDNQVKICGVTIPKYCAMLDDFDTKPFRETEDVLTYMNTYTFKLKFKKNNDGTERIGFKLETLAVGFNKKSATAPDGKAEIKVADPEAPTDREKDQPVATPQMLDANGDLTTTPYYETWVVNDLVNFSLYGLPTSYPVS